LVSQTKGRAKTEVESRVLDLRGRKWREAGGDYIMRSFITFLLLLLLSRRYSPGWALASSFINFTLHKILFG
jgi:hypothetical protein